MKESTLTDVFLHAAFFLALSALVIPLLRFFKIPVALGYLFAGIILGPYVLGAYSDQSEILAAISLTDAEHVKILAELGIVLLLFVIGLELTPRRLWQMRTLVFGLGGAQVLVTSIVIGCVAYMWGNGWQVSLLLGLGLALSSTALVIQWLHEQKLFVTHVGRTSFSVLLFQDLAVIPILLLLTILSTDTQQDFFEFAFVALAKMGVAVLLIYFVGRIILKPLFVFANKHGGSEVFMALSLLIIVTSASVASLAGLSMALGAFIAGMLLADTEYRYEIESFIVPFKSMLLGIFFLSFGMGINLSFIAFKPVWLFASVIGLMCIKGLIIFVLCKLWKQSTAVSVEAGILLSQAGEFGLLVVGSALAVGLIEVGVGQFMLIIVGVTMLLTPILCPLARKIGQHIENKHYKGLVYQDNSLEKSDHVVVFGFGRIGKMISESLSNEGLEVVCFDNDIVRVHSAQKGQCPVYYGDATKKSTHNAAKIDDASCIVIAIDNPQATKDAVKTIRTHNSYVPIVVRAQNEESLDEMQVLENVDVVAEHLIVSSSLSEQVLLHCK